MALKAPQVTAAVWMLGIVAPDCFTTAGAAVPTTGIQVSVGLIIGMTFRAVCFGPLYGTYVTPRDILLAGDRFQVGNLSAVPGPAEMVKFRDFVNVEVMGESIGNPVDKLVAPAIAVVDQAVATFDQ